MYCSSTARYFLLSSIISLSTNIAAQQLQLNDKGYLHTQGLDITFFSDFYPDGHQSGVTIIQHGTRVAANGDLRLEPSPGQWSPHPAGEDVSVDEETQMLSKRLSYPNPERDRKRFNPIIYPDLEFSYEVRIQPLEGSSFQVTVDLDEPLPAEWIGKVGFNLELFPGELFGKSWIMLDRHAAKDDPDGPKEGPAAAGTTSKSEMTLTGIFQTQPEGPLVPSDSFYISAPIATGRQLVVAPEDPYRKITITSVRTGTSPKNGVSGAVGVSDLQLLDGRTNHNNGWYIVRSLIPEGATKNAISWTITPNVVDDWKYTPVIQVSQLGYHPDQEKKVIIELDGRDVAYGSSGPDPADGTAHSESAGSNPESGTGHSEPVEIIKSDASGKTVVKSIQPEHWGNFLRYQYVIADFSEIIEPGIYQVKYGEQLSHPFRIDESIFSKNTWQPTLEYFLPVQMCHMRVNEKYRVWHDLCHLDDALMAPSDHNHFDGYRQGPDNFTEYEPGDAVPGLNSGGWHDAGDYDLRVESQAGTVRMLALMIEEFGLEWDATLIDQENKLVEIHTPDGESDVLQQIEHGLLTILGGYRSLGRLYRGIICQDLRQYVMLGDAASMTDNLVFEGESGQNKKEPEQGAKNSNTPTFHPGFSPVNDDRWVFTEDNPSREMQVAAALSAASRVLKEYNPELSEEALEVAQVLVDQNLDRRVRLTSKVMALAELYLSTKDQALLEEIYSLEERIIENIDDCGPALARIVEHIDNKAFSRNIEKAVAAYQDELEKQQAEDSPYGVPYKPNIWGAGWTIQSFGVDQYFFHKGWPDHASSRYFENALNFVLGVHPGSNNASFASGVGANSVLVAYGVNRADWSFIPGGVASGTALIRPDLPEMKEWPFFWQQTEYVMGGGATNFMFLVLAVENEYK